MGRKRGRNMTDSEVKARVDRIAAELMPLRTLASRTEAQQARGVELERDLLVMEDEWRELKQKRRAGTLTDRSRLDELHKFIDLESRLKGFHVRITEEEEPEVYDNTHCRVWEISVSYGGREEDFDRDRWCKLLWHLQGQTIQPYILRSFVRATITEILGVWLVDTWVWDEPPRLKTADD